MKETKQAKRDDTTRRNKKPAKERKRLSLAILLWLCFCTTRLRYILSFFHQPSSSLPSSSSSLSPTSLSIIPPPPLPLPPLHRPPLALRVEQQMAHLHVPPPVCVCVCVCVRACAHACVHLFVK